MAIGRISGQMLKANLLRSGTDLAFETNLLVLDVTNSRVGVGTATPAVQFHVSGTGAIRIPSGNDSQRPGSPANGDIRYNSEQSYIEGYSNGGWTNLTDQGIDNVVDDTTPQLGGNLDINGFDITSARSNENINITPNGTGSVVLSKVDIGGGEIDGTVIGANSAAAGTFTTLTTTGNTTIGGNLTVNGTTTTIDSVTLTIEDPILELAKNNSGGAANTYDQGLLFNRGSEDNVSFIWDESADQFAFAVTSGEDGTTAGNVTIDSYADIQAKDATLNKMSTQGISIEDNEILGLRSNDDLIITPAGTGSVTMSKVDINSGAIDGTTIGAASAAAGTFTNLTANGTIDIDSTGTGNIDNVVIGANTAVAGTFTTVTATNVQATNIKANDGTAAIVITDSTGAVAISTNVDVNGGNFTFNESGAAVDFRIEGDTDTDLFVADGSADKIGISTAAGSIGYVLDASGSTDAFRLPSGDTSERPTAATGIIRFNTQTGKYEGCQDGSTYTEFATAGDVPIISKVSTTGDGSTSVFTGFFSTAPASVANVLVFIDNVYQEPTENYTVSSTNITFTSAPHSGARIFAIVGFDNTALASGGVVRTETSATNFTSSATTIMSFNATSYRAAECFIITTDSANTEYEVAKALIVHDGTTAYVTVYGQTSSTGSDLSTYTATLSGGSVLLQAVSAGGQQSAKVQYSLSAV